MLLFVKPTFHTVECHSREGEFEAFVVVGQAEKEYFCASWGRGSAPGPLDPLLHRRQLIWPLRPGSAFLFGSLQNKKLDVGYKSLESHLLACCQGVAQWKAACLFGRGLKTACAANTTERFLCSVNSFGGSQHSQLLPNDTRLLKHALVRNAETLWLCALRRENHFVMRQQRWALAVNVGVKNWWLASVKKSHSRCCFCLNFVPISFYQRQTQTRLLTGTEWMKDWATGLDQGSCGCGSLHGGSQWDSVQNGRSTCTGLGQSGVEPVSEGSESNCFPVQLLPQNVHRSLGPNHLQPPFFLGGGSSLVQKCIVSERFWVRVSSVQICEKGPILSCGQSYIRCRRGGVEEQEVLMSPFCSEYLWSRHRFTASIRRRVSWLRPSHAWLPLQALAVSCLLLFWQKNFGISGEKPWGKAGLLGNPSCVRHWYIFLFFVLIRLWNSEWRRTKFTRPFNLFWLSFERCRYSKRKVKSRSKRELERDRNKKEMRREKWLFYNFAFSGTDMRLKQPQNSFLIWWIPRVRTSLKAYSCHNTSITQHRFQLNERGAWKEKDRVLDFVFSFPHFPRKKSRILWIPVSQAGPWYSEPARTHYTLGIQVSCPCSDTLYSSALCRSNSSSEVWYSGAKRRPETKTCRCCGRLGSAKGHLVSDRVLSGCRWLVLQWVLCLELLLHSGPGGSVWWSPTRKPGHAARFVSSPSCTPLWCSVCKCSCRSGLCAYPRTWLRCRTAEDLPVAWAEGGTGGWARSCPELRSPGSVCSKLGSQRWTCWDSTAARIWTCRRRPSSDGTYCNKNKQHQDQTREFANKNSERARLGANSLARLGNFASKHKT